MSKKIVELSQRALIDRSVNYTWCASLVTNQTMEKFAQYILEDFLADHPQKDELVSEYIRKVKSDPFEPQE